MCFRQKNYSERDCNNIHRQWTNGKHSNQDCDRAYIKQQHFKKRSFRDLKLLCIKLQLFTLANGLKFVWTMGDCAQRSQL